MKQHWKTALKGLIVGSTMLVPGVSGASMAMILGVYGRLVSSVSSFFRDKKGNLLFLLLFALGGGTGMLLFARPLLALIERYPMPTLYFFLGAVLGGVPMTVREAGIRRFSWRIPVFAALGLAIVLALNLLPANLFGSEAGFLPLLLAGILAAVALVLPGISVSYLLLLLGLYDETMLAITELRVPFLLALGVGLMLGIVLTTKLLERAMLRHPEPTYLIILGFLFGSVLQVFPGVPTGWELLLCPITLLAGFFALWFLSKREAALSAGQAEERSGPKRETAL